jgi:hypothetical protein
MTETLSSLSATCKNVYARLGCWGVTTIGIALQERKTASAAELYRVSHKEFPELIDKCDLVMLCREFFRTDIPSVTEVNAIKRLLKSFYSTGGGEKVRQRSDTTNVVIIVLIIYFYPTYCWEIVALFVYIVAFIIKVWRKWSELKHVYRNIYRPYFKMGSGENEDDGILHAVKHHWAYKKNKNLKVHNNKCIKDGKPDQQKDLVSHLDAPDNLNQSAELYPEAIVYLIFREHPIFQPDSASLCSTPDSSPTENGSADDVEDKTLRNRMSSKGLFKSRNVQRAEEMERKKKAKVSDGNLEIIDLTREKASAASKHAEAAKSQVEVMRYQCRLQALDQAMRMGVDENILRPFMVKTLTGLFADDTDGNKDDDGDVKIIDLVNEEATIITTLKSGRGSSTARNKNKTNSIPRRMRCCAGNQCVYPDELLGDDLKCDVCNKPVHAFCVNIDNGLTCFNCIIERNEEAHENGIVDLDSD